MTSEATYTNFSTFKLVISSLGMLKVFIFLPIEALFKLPDLQFKKTAFSCKQSAQGILVSIGVL